MPMPSENPQPVTARLTSAAQLVASLPVYLGFTPTESVVVVCQDEPRGRVGLTMRFDLPAPEHEELFVDDAVRRVLKQTPSRLVVAVYTSEPDGAEPARAALVDTLLDRLPRGLRITDAVLVRDGRFWSYLCDDRCCCPSEGTPVEAARDDDQVRVIEAAQVLRGRAPLPDRTALERSLAGPVFLAAARARAVFERVEAELARDWREDRDEAQEQLLDEWEAAVGGQPALPNDVQAARLVVSLEDRLLRDTVAASFAPDVLLPLLAELCRRTPEPYDAGIATLFAWTAYCEGGGAEVTIALDRAQRTDPAYSLAGLLRAHVDQQTSPEELRRVTREVADVLPLRRRSSD